jgi:hypothetical protein
MRINSLLEVPENNYCVGFIGVFMLKDGHGFFFGVTGQRLMFDRSSVAVISNTKFAVEFVPNLYVSRSCKICYYHNRISVLWWQGLPGDAVV